MVHIVFTNPPDLLIGPFKETRPWGSRSRRPPVTTITMVFFLFPDMKAVTTSCSLYRNPSEKQRIKKYRFGCSFCGGIAFHPEQIDGTYIDPFMLLQKPIQKQKQKEMAQTASGTAPVRFCFFLTPVSFFHRKELLPYNTIGSSPGASFFRSVLFQKAHLFPSPGVNRFPRHSIQESSQKGN